MTKNRIYHLTTVEPDGTKKHTQTLVSWLEQDFDWDEKHNIIRTKNNLNIKKHFKDRMGKFKLWKLDSIIIVHGRKLSISFGYWNVYHLDNLTGSFYWQFRPLPNKKIEGNRRLSNMTLYAMDLHEDWS